MTTNFPAFAAAVQSRYNDIARGELFVVDVEDLFATYLAAFPEGTNPMFRVRTEHDCNADKNFIRRLGHVVAIDDNGNRLTIWDDFPELPEPYGTVARTLANTVRQAPIRGVFRTKERVYGSEPNWDNHDSSIRWTHFVGRVTDKHHARDPETKRGEKGAIAQVLRRGLDELRTADIETVLDLIEAKALYRGEEHLPAIRGFRELQQAYAKANDRDAFVWSHLDDRSARFRNTVIGTLLVDLADGVELERAVKSFETKVAPANYKRPTALITPKMIDEAMKTLNDLGLEGAVNRRFARLSDVSVNDVLFVDNSVQDQMRDGLAGLLMEAVKPQTVDIKHAEAIRAEDFLSAVVPGASKIELLVQNRHLGNFVSLTGGDGPERLFKWDNNFAWSYDGDVADSIKQRVKAAGGKTGANVKLRVSLAWSNSDDLDVHAFDPRGRHIYFGDKQGVLDVDMNAGGRSNPTDPVENLSWTSLVDGEYRIEVNNFSKRMNDRVGFTLEVETDGRLEQFTHSAGLANHQTVKALTLTVKNGVVTAVRPSAGLVGGSMSTAKWGVSTETLVPVDTLMLSPNFWSGQGVGNKHWFFMLKGCKNPDPARGIYNEFLRGDLDRHRKVFEVLGAKTKCPPTDDQLSGVGFSSTRSDTVIAVVNGRRAYNIQF